MTAQENAPKTRAAIPAFLEKPGIRQTPNGIDLDPMEVHKTGRLTALIERLKQYLEETDKFFVKVTGWNVAEPRGSYESPVLEFGPPNLRTLNLEPKLVAFNLRQKIEVEYTVHRDGETSVTSEVLEVNVLDLLPKELKKGVLFGKDDDGTGPVLDLNADTKDRTVRIDIWPLIAVGQWCWIVLKGKRADDSGDYDLPLFKGPVDQAWITQGYKEVPVLFSGLKLLGDGTKAMLEYMVAFDQVDDEDEANLSEVRSYTVKNASVLRPEIIAMRDFNGVDIPNGGFTAANGVKLMGTAVAGQQVRIFRGGTEIDSVDADSEGRWEYKFEKTNLNRHSFAAVASDGTYSAFWMVFFLREGVPIITRVTDSRGEAISEYSATTESSVTMEGTAVPDEELRISLDGGHRAARVNADGVWRCALTELKKQRYGVFVFPSDPSFVSFWWSLNVVEADTPVITSITDSSNRAIYKFGGTYDRTVKLTGTARSDGEIQVFLGEDAIGERFKADTNGVWNRTLTLNPHYHIELGVKAFYGAEEMSPSVLFSIWNLPTDFDDADGDGHD